MKVLIRVGEGESVELHRWLSRDPVRREIEIAKISRPGQMGAELVQAVIANMIALPGLVLAVGGYLDDRRRRLGGAPVSATFECNGVPIQITGGDPAEVERIVRALAEAERPLPGGEGGIDEARDGAEQGR